MKIYPSNMNHLRYTKPTAQEIQEQYYFPCSITVLNLTTKIAEVFYYDGDGAECALGKTEIPSDYLIKKSLSKTDAAPTVIGLYPLKETGTYANLGNINAEAGKLNFASFDGSVWSLINIDINPSIEENLDIKINNVKGKIIPGEYYNFYGDIGYHSTLARTPLIPIDKLSDITITNSKNGGAYNNVVFFDNSKTFISGLNLSNPNLLKSSDIPNNAAFISINSDNDISQLIKEGNDVVFGDLAQFNIPTKNKKLVTGGDSLTANLVWQPRLVELKDFTFDKKEVSDGVGFVKLDGSFLPSYQQDQTGLTLNTTDGFYYDGSGGKWRKAYKMAIGGTAMKPTNADSISIRLRDAVHYQPDVLLIYGGQNDPLDWWKSTNNAGTNYDEIVSIETATQVTSPDNNVSTIAAYKGLLEYLINVSPKTQIFLVTQMRVLGRIGMNPSGIYENIYKHPRFANGNEVLDWEKTERLPKCEYIKAIGRHYGLPVIDLYNETGVTNGNAEYWYPEPAEDCTQVHPTDEGYFRMAETIAKYL